MSRPSARTLRLSGILCLVGQGILLYAAGQGSRAPELIWPWLYHVLAAVLTATLAARLPSDAGDVRSRLQRLLGLAAAVALLGLGIGLHRASSGAGGVSGDVELRLERAATQVRSAAERLAELAPRLAADLTGGTFARFGANTAGGDAGEDELFREVAAMADSWTSLSSTVFPLGVSVWRGTERLAWSVAAHPVPIRDGFQVVRRTDASDSSATVSNTTTLNTTDLVAIDGSVLVRRIESRGALHIEFQMILTDRGLFLADRSVSVETGLDVGTNGVWGEARFAPNEPTVERDVLLDDSDGDRLVLWAAAESISGGLASRALLLVSLWLVWLLVLLDLAWSFTSAWGVLAGLWIARTVLAVAELRVWIVAAFPTREFPAAPGSWLSLLDPAYFATPVGGGWFASTGDAVVTAALFGLTVRWILRMRGLLGSTVSGEPLRNLPGVGPGSGLVFGLISGAGLLLLNAGCGLLAANANPRLIGTAVSLSSLPFWGLHAALMVSGFSLFCLLAALPAGAEWPRAGERRRWFGGAVTAALAAGLLVGVVGERSDSGGLTAGLLSAILWLGAPAMSARPRILRRFVWPGLVMLMVIWNHASLRQVYEQAETAWLQRKASLITAADQDWTRYLLGSVLAEMQDLDGREPEGEPRGEIWRDQRAWRLWRSSALHDLGYSCLVEVLDADEQSASWFAQGFLRDYRFEVTDRSDWEASETDPLGGGADAVFQAERRVYLGGEEEIIVAEAPRLDGTGWLRVELPVRSWRISTLSAGLSGVRNRDDGRYRPRSELDRPTLLLLADDTGWLRSGGTGFPAPPANTAVARLRTGADLWAEVTVGDDTWLCIWNPLPAAQARTPGEGFVLGLRRSTAGDRLLDLSRLMLLDLVLFALLFLAVQGRRRLTRGGSLRWHPGFQEKFLAGYLLLGLILLLVVGMSVDRVGYERVRTEAREQTRDGLAMGVEQLRSLLAEQARSLAESDYILELLRGQLAGQRPAGSEDVRQGMVFLADGRLVLDETLSDLGPVEAAALLAAARSAPMILIRENGALFAGAVVPIVLGADLVEAVGGLPPDPTGHGGNTNNAFFLYRQRLDTALLGGLADLLNGEVTLRLEGTPVLSSHPAPFFAGTAPLLADPDLMATLVAHPHGPEVSAAAGRPFAFTGFQPLPVFVREADGDLTGRSNPAVLAVSFPDREREFASQRRGTILFLTGLANLILLTALVLAVLMSWNLFRPLHVLLTATRSLARGDYDAPLPESGGDEVGRLTGAFGVMRSQLHTARDELAAREGFLATVLERVPVGVVVLADGDRLAALNPAGRRILGEFASEFPPETGARRLLTAIRDLQPGAPPVVSELTSDDGTRTLRAALAPMTDPAGADDVMVVFEDITDFLAHKKMALNAELARQVAHEIKNPLTPIQLSAQLLGQAWRDQHPQLDRIVDESVARILEQVSLLRRIASEFSLLGRPDELATVAVDLPGIVERVVSAYAVERPGGGGDARATDAPTVVAAPDGVPVVQVPPVRAHEESLLKILGNLMQNSLDAARDGVPLEIDLGWQVTTERVVLIWRDNGSGLAPEVADRLFDPYFSTKSKGTGLGLAICRSLAERMGGSISLANRDDGPGAVAQLSLPIVDPPAPPDRETP